MFNDNINIITPLIRVGRALLQLEKHRKKTSTIHLKKSFYWLKLVDNIEMLSSECTGKHIFSKTETAKIIPRTKHLVLGQRTYHYHDHSQNFVKELFDIAKFIKYNKKGDSFQT